VGSRSANAAHNPDLHSTLILCPDLVGPRTATEGLSVRPQYHQHSSAGMAYPVGSATNVIPSPATSVRLSMGPAIAASKSVACHKRLPEFGLSQRTPRCTWLPSVGRYIMLSGALFASYFNGKRSVPDVASH